MSIHQNPDQIRAQRCRGWRKQLRHKLSLRPHVWDKLQLSPLQIFQFHIGRKSCTKEINVTGRQGNINRGRRPINQPWSDSEGIRPLLWVQSILPACPLTPC